MNTQTAVSLIKREDLALGGCSLSCLLTSPVPKYVECSYFRSDFGQLIRVCIGAWRCGFASVLSSNAAALCSSWLDKLWNSTCAGNVEVIF